MHSNCTLLRKTERFVLGLLVRMAVFCCYVESSFFMIFIVEKTVLLSDPPVAIFFA